MSGYGSNCSALALPKPTPRHVEQRAQETDKGTTWRMLRTLVRERAGGVCQACGTRYGCDAHHLRPRSLGGKDEPQNLGWLCRACHQDVHAKLLRPVGSGKRLRFVRER